MGKHIDTSWHLATTETEASITNFEMLLWRVFYGFLRWQEDCERCLNNNNLNGDDLAILHIIRMKDRAKTIYDIGRLLNRDDTHNINYSIKKLFKMGLIEKGLGPTKASSYQITAVGKRDTDAYAEARRSILIDMFNKELSSDIEHIIQALAKIKGIYDEAGRVATTYRSASLNESDGNEF
jgi:predicted MarR family transcription regulator